MPKTAVADIIVPTLFEQYAIERTAELSRFWESGIVEMAPEVDAQVSDAPHLFESNAGGGAAGNGAGGAVGSSRSVTNPFRKDTWNVTEQMRLIKSDPQMAARLKAAAKG